MIRFTKIIKKDDIFKYMNDLNVSKISIPRRINNLNDTSVVKVHLFINVDWTKFCSMLAHLKQLAEGTKIGPGVNPFFKGLGNCKHCGFITKTDVQKIINIETTYNIKCAITKNYIELINKYK